MGLSALSSIAVDPRFSESVALRNGTLVSSSAESTILIKLYDESLAEEHVTGPNIPRINSTGKLVSLACGRKLNVKVISGGIAELELDSDIIWTGWCPQSQLGEHICVLTGTGMLKLYHVDVAEGRFSLQNEILARSQEDWTLKCISAAFGPTCVFVLLENGDVVKVDNWLPLPCVLPSDLERVSEEHVLFGKNDILVSKLKNPKSKVLPPCALQPEPLEAVGSFDWIQTCEHRGLTFILLNTGSSRVDVFLDLTNECPNGSNSLLALLESIELPRSRSKLLCQQFEIEGPPKFIFTQCNETAYLVEFTWADQLVDSVLYEVSVNLLKSKVTELKAVDPIVALPFTCHLTGSLKALVFSPACNFIFDVSRYLQQLADRSATKPPALSFVSEVLKHLDIRPQDSEYSPRISFDPQIPTRPSSTASKRLQDLDEASLLSLLDKVADPLRSGPLAQLVSASNALTLLSAQIDEAIDFQTQWLSNLSKRLEEHKAKLTHTQEHLASTQSKQQALKLRLCSLVERARSNPTIEFDFDQLSSLARSIQLSAALQAAIPIPEASLNTYDVTSIADICRRLSNIRTK